jgi:hypothetical protein
MGCLRPVICCVCDGIPSDSYWHEMITVNHLSQLCNTGMLHKCHVSEFYPTALVEQYTAPHELLTDYVLSPETYIDNNQQVCICKACLHDLENNNKVRANQRKPPKQSIANGYLIGNEPEELKCLNEAELALISLARTHCQTWVFYAGCHKQIQG